MVKKLLKSLFALSAIVLCAPFASAADSAADAQSEVKFATVTYPRFFELKVPVVDNKIEWTFEVTSSWPINTIFYYDDDQYAAGKEITSLLPKNGILKLDDVTGDNPHIVFSLCKGNQDTDGNKKLDNTNYKVYVKNNEICFDTKDGSPIANDTQIILTNLSNRILYKENYEKCKNGIAVIDPGVYLVYVEAVSSKALGKTDSSIGGYCYNVYVPGNN